MLNSTADIAIIGMAGRFPEADSIEAFWSNLVAGESGIKPIADEDLHRSVTPERKNDPRFVQVGASVKNPAHFDAAFFRIYPKEAKIMDPQHRLFLECCWEAIEDAGYYAEAYPGSIGVYAGSSINTYILSSLASGPAFIKEYANSLNGGLGLNAFSNEKDYLATRVSYKLNLKGPSLSLQTACSTSMVAVVQACSALATYQCDMALAGGVCIKLPQDRGYVANTDTMVSPDGKVRTFDAKAHGTVFGNGVGAVFLKRLDDAVADGDSIYAVIKGWGMSNDGGNKAGFTAPSIEGQKDTILRAHRSAGIDPRTITYVEAHGTGTLRGDPVEIEALTEAFGESTDETQFCKIGSVKTNIGHLDAASGVAGLIKTTLALKHKMLPASLNFETPNPAIPFEQTPFIVNDTLTEWQTDQLPRRAGVSSLGVGGTNAHLVLEEAPAVEEEPSEAPCHLILLSAKSSTAADAQAGRLLAHLKKNPAEDLADLAYTLQRGRKTMRHSRMFVANDTREAIRTLSSRDPQKFFSRKQTDRDRSVVFLFPGQGSQHLGMGGDLYDHEPVYRNAIDQCSQIVSSFLGFDLRMVLSPSARKKAGPRLPDINRTSLAQPGIFAVSYALASMWLDRGIQPRAVIGHSVGEFVAACLAGVFSLEDGLKLVAMRGRLMQDMPTGAMLAVRTGFDTVRQHAVEGIDVAAVNSPSMCVLAGPHDRIDEMQNRFEELDIPCKRLHTSHAFHSAMMQDAIAPFEEMVQTISLSPPKIPIMSTVSAAWLTDEQAMDPWYWASHLRETVRFSDAISAIAASSEDVFLEVGPGHTLSTLTRQHPDTSEAHDAFSSLPHVRQSISATRYSTEVTGKLWQSGVEIDWTSLYVGESRQRIHLPTYPFERKYFWYDEEEASPTIEPQYVSEGDGHLTNGHQEAIPVVHENASSNHHDMQPSMYEEEALIGREVAPSPVTPVLPYAGKDANRAMLDQQLHLMALQIQSWREQLKE